MYEFVKVHSHKNAVTIEINRPDVLNALNNQLMNELLAAVKSLPKDTRLLVLRGAGGKAFAAGADLNEMRQRTMWTELDFGVRRQLANFLENAPFVTLAAIQGFALGGGLEIALACHLRVASSSAVLGLPETQLGILPGNGGTARLTRLVGKGRALQLILLGERFNANTALDYGVVNWVFNQETFDQDLEELKDRLVNLSPISTRAAIDAVMKADDMTLDQAVENEHRWFQICMESPDKEEGINAFFEKRKAVFSKQIN